MVSGSLNGRANRSRESRTNSGSFGIRTTCPRPRSHEVLTASGRTGLGQIFMGRKPPAGGRTPGVAAHKDGPFHGTRDHPPFWRHRFGGPTVVGVATGLGHPDRKSTRLNSSH